MRGIRDSFLEAMNCKMNVMDRTRQALKVSVELPAGGDGRNPSLSW
jgi:hypothetical protein